MNEKKLIMYIEALSVSSARKKRNVKSIRKFMNYCQRHDIVMESIDEQVVSSFLGDYYRKYSSVFYLEDLKVLLDYQGLDHQMIDRLKYEFTPPFKLEGFEMDKYVLDKLKLQGIRTNHQLLEKYQQVGEFKVLALSLGLEEEITERLVRLSDLVRIFAVKGKRARLYYEAGLDTIGKIASMSPEGLIDVVKDYIKMSGFDGVATLPKEAEFTVEFAKKLPIIIE